MNSKEFIILWIMKFIIKVDKIYLLKLEIHKTTGIVIVKMLIPISRSNYHFIINRHSSMQKIKLCKPVPITIDLIHKQINNKNKYMNINSHRHNVSVPVVPLTCKWFLLTVSTYSDFRDASYPFDIWTSQSS